MPRTLYAWQDKSTLKLYLSAFPPLMQDVLDDPGLSAQLTDAAKYRPAMEFDTLDKLDQEVARRSTDRRGVQVPGLVILKWDVGHEPDGS